MQGGTGVLAYFIVVARRQPRRSSCVTDFPSHTVHTSCMLHREYHHIIVQVPSNGHSRNHIGTPPCSLQPFADAATRGRHEVDGE